MEIVSHNPDGLGSRDIRHVLGKIIDIDEDGNECQLFAAVGNLHCSSVIAIAIDEDGDLVLITDHAQDVMSQLGTWDEFTSDPA